LGCSPTNGHLEKLISLPIADSPGVNVYESEREQSGIIRRQSWGARSEAAIFRGALNAFADTVIVVGNDEIGRVHFYKGADEYSSLTADAKAKTKCMNMGMALCLIFHRLNGSNRAPQCLAIVVRPSPAPVRDVIYYAVAPDGSAAISDAEAQCDASGPSCILSELVCDPESADDFSGTPDNSATLIVHRFFDGSSITKIIDHIRDGLKSREALVFYGVAFGFGLFVLLSLYDIIAHDRRSIRRMALNFVLSCAATATVLTSGFVAPPIWEWILSLDTPAFVLLTTVICGMMALFIPIKFWKTLKERNTLARTSLSEAPEESVHALKDDLKTEHNKKAIKERILKSRTEKFDL
jgi:hypothetical protein